MARPKKIHTRGGGKKKPLKEQLRFAKLFTILCPTNIKHPPAGKLTSRRRANQKKKDNIMAAKSKAKKPAPKKKAAAKKKKK